MKLSILTALGGLCCLSPAFATGTSALDARFGGAVLPFLQAHCVDCHGGDRPKARFDVSVYQGVDSVINDFGHWELILDMLVEGEMPPEDAERQPTAEERADVIDWIRQIRRREADRNAGDPGVVLARRLSNAEYDHTIRDLTGVDIRPTREFPIDPANEAGFDNSGESLTLSPALLNKYLEAARTISEHLVLLPEGFTFASHPAVTDTDRDKYAVKRIVDFYQRQPVDLAGYFLAAWRIKHEIGSSASPAQVGAMADKSNLSPKYLAIVRDLLIGEELNHGPVAELRERWNAVPGPESISLLEARSKFADLAREVEALRAKLAVDVPFLKLRGIHTGSQTFVLWHNRRQAMSRRLLNRDALHFGESNNPLGEIADTRLVIRGDADQRAAELAAFERFCSVFPDAFFISERGREFLGREDGNAKNEQGRLLSAGFHSMMGYFRDDQPLRELILSDAEREELDVLWEELDFVTAAPMRQHAGFVWFERTDSRYMRDEKFDFARAEDKDVTSEEKIKELGRVYLEKAVEIGAEDPAQEAIREYFENINASVRWVERARVEAEESHVAALLDFAQRAYRRPLTDEDRRDLTGFYHAQRNADGGDHEGALRDCVVAVLVSPHFWYRVDLPPDAPGVHPLNDIQLASRLSYFLWSSMPDEELLEAAAKGTLLDPAVLVQQTRRMLQDPKARGMAVEFAGNWLGFRRFESHNSVDRERFPAFDDGLRRAMFEEPVRFFTDVLRDNRPVTDFLFSDDTFVNAELAAHYAMDVNGAGPDDWIAVDRAVEAGRGGLLPMAVFQTMNAPGLRTSPVKRGYWVVRQLLGEHIPPPPPNVPELPDNEGIGHLTLREQLARHRDDKSCFPCHERFDSIGLAFEGYGPVGERRTVDLGNRPVDVTAVFPGGFEGSGLEGLKDYLREHRREEFVDNLCRKLFAYALGRGLLLSDDAAIEAMKSRLEREEFRMHALIEGIVTSPQFLNRRGRADLAQH